ncbi:alginate lyase family protein [Paucibacter sp. R3-3]|uniref:Alginate lyase family protein n=1 Tax=Roseateles agri TaxID=3098619 RepID=A0ABU5DDP3_9BURK|nr:alginate lyase family protein [Paucibacter sp. R3-3]MDY0743853.1 alginate lyase family protein [Paucibacter sp. R3-3]
MSARELAHRVFVQVRNYTEKAGWLPEVRVPSRIATPAQLQPWCGQVETIDAASYLRRADAVLCGELDVFSKHAAKIGHPPRWLQDPLTGISLPLVYGPTMPIGGHAAGFDIKGVWEPARHQQWPWLVQAWLISGDTRYLAGLREQLISWLDANPYPRGPHWASALEPALRLINWAWIWRATGGAEGLLFEADAALLERFYEALYLQQRFISRHLSLYSSANNHLVGEAAGWFVAAQTWPLWPESAAWQARSHALLEREMARQYTEDGVNREQAFAYQSFVNELFLAAALVPIESRDRFSSQFWQRLESAVEFPAHVADAAGNLPQFGDADDGAALKLTLSERPVWRELMAVSAVLRGRADFKTSAGAQPDALLWWLGPNGPSLWNELQPGSLAPRRDFRRGGYVVLGDAGDQSDAIRIVADVGPLGYLSIAAHGHADALSFTLSVGARAFLVDPGTGCYSAHPEWRRFFRSTAAHNTVMLDDEEQSLSAGPFMWIRHARTTTQAWFEGDHEQILEAEHDGYSRLQDPVTHRRKWHYRATQRRLEVLDTFECRAGHRARWTWHFAPGVQVRLQPQELVATVGNRALTMTLPAHCQAWLVRGDDSMPQGWYSGSYLQREAATCCVVEAEVAGNQSWLTVLEVGGTSDSAEH